jgi:hypothetical protein
MVHVFMLLFMSEFCIGRFAWCGDYECLFVCLIKCTVITHTLSILFVPFHYFIVALLVLDFIVVSITKVVCKQVL